MASTSQPPTDATQVKHERRPFNGSCHCGAVQYIAYLNVPYPGPQAGIERLYRCNCRICHKIGFMHIRVPNVPDDFLLLSPLDPFKELGDYQCARKKLHFFFCKTCGVRCFIFMGEGRVSDVEIEADSLDIPLERLTLSDEAKEQPKKKSVKVWHSLPDGEAVNIPHGQYLSVNAHTIDADQEGFDMRDWADKKAIQYLDYLKAEHDGASRYDRPHIGGCY